MHLMCCVLPQYVALLGKAGVNKLTRVNLLGCVCVILLLCTGCVFLPKTVKDATLTPFAWLLCVRKIL